VKAEFVGSNFGAYSQCGRLLERESTIPNGSGLVESSGSLTGT